MTEQQKPGELLSLLAKVSAMDLKARAMQQAIEQCQYNMLTPMGGVLFYHDPETLPGYWEVYLFDGLNVGVHFTTKCDNKVSTWGGPISSKEKMRTQCAALSLVLDYLLVSQQTPSEILGALLNSEEDLRSLFKPSLYQ